MALRIEGKIHLGREQVYTAIDQVRNVRFGLLDVVQNTFRVRVRHDATEVCGGIVADPCTQDHGLGILLLEQLQHLPQREGAAHVRIQARTIAPACPSEWHHGNDRDRLRYPMPDIRADIECGIVETL